MGYVTDISSPKHLVKNQGKLSGVGYLLGLAVGYVVAVAILVVVGSGTPGNWHGNFITVSLITGMVIILIGCAALCYGLEESMPKEERPKALPWGDANPFRIFTICGTNPYLACCVTFIFTTSIGGAASEAIIGTLYAVSFLQTYGANYILPLLLFIMAIFFAGAIGASCFTNCYKTKLGFKNACHVIFLGNALTTGIAMTLFPVTQNPVMQWVAVLCALVFGPGQPLTMAYFMGQCPSEAEKATFSGLFRTIQAFGKMTGSIIGGIIIAPVWVKGMTGFYATGTPYGGAFFLPFFVYMLMPVIAYLAFVVGEVMFKEHDMMGWRGDDDGNAGFTDIFMRQKSRDGLAEIEKKRSKRIEGGKAPANPAATAVAPEKPAA